jgi:hypothetical protein
MARGVLAAAVSFSLLPAGEAAAQAPCATTSPAVFTVGGEHCFTLPAGVTSVQVVAIGGRGADGGSYALDNGGRGGAGTRVAASLPYYFLGIGAGDSLFVHVGWGGGGGGLKGPDYSGRGTHGGGGGGGSDVRTTSCGGPCPADDAILPPTTLTSRVLVAGGGGGGGGGAHGGGNAILGGSGGGGGTAAPSPAGGGNGLPVDPDGGYGGGPGGATAGGFGGQAAANWTFDGAPGVRGAGGGGGHGYRYGTTGVQGGQGAGGGGGGYWGGGGGAGSWAAGTAGGGGGAGSSLVPAGGRIVADPDGVPKIIVSYHRGVPNDISLSLSPTVLSANGTSTTTATITVTDTEGDKVAAEPVTLASSDPGHVISDVIDNGNGTYTAKIRASTTAGAATITAKDGALTSAPQTLEQKKRTTDTAVACTPSPAPVDADVTCTATVSDNDDGNRSRPGGTVEFSTPGGALGSCTLPADPAPNSCSAPSFTPAATGPLTVTAEYQGDDLHRLTTRTTNLSVTKRATSMGISCDPEFVPLAAPGTCTVTVSDSSAETKSAPSGQVSFSAQLWNISTTCDLAAISASASSCDVTYTPAFLVVGVQSTASYAGSDKHGASSATKLVNATRRKTATVVTCDPATAALGSSTTCTASVSDDEAGTKGRPDKTVSFTTEGAGSFSPATCTLPSAGDNNCSAVYTPASSGSVPHAITATYNGDSGDRYATSSDTTNVTVSAAPSATAVACDPATRAIGQATTCTATVTGTPRPDGNVSFASDSSGTFGSAGSCSLPASGATSCSVTYTPSAQDSGTHAITATFDGGAVHTGSAGDANLAVTARPTSTSVSCDAFKVGVVATCTATVSDGADGAQSAPGGDVAFTTDSSGTFGSAYSCTLSGDAAAEKSCSVTYTPLARGSGPHTVAAEYGGTGVHAGSSGDLTAAASKGSSSTTVACAPASRAVGQASVCTMSVSGDGQRPSGTLTLTSDVAGTVGDCTLPASADNECDVSYTPGSVGSGEHELTAAFGGDDNYDASSAVGTVTVSKTDPVVQVSCAPGSLAVGAESTCTATVTGTGARPSGTVDFSTGGSGTLGSAGSCDLPADGDARCSVSYTPSAVGTGTHAIAAGYGGDDNYNDESASTAVAVSRADSETAVSCDPATPKVGEATTCTVTATGAGATPQGDIEFTTSYDGDFSGSGTCTLDSNAQCSVTFTPLLVGSDPHTITASYDGDSNHDGSEGSDTVEVAPGTASVGVACAPASLTVGEAATCTATVTGGGDAPGGTVGFASDGTGAVGSPGTCTLDSAGQCSLSYEPTAVGDGDHGITASYEGDANYSEAEGATGVAVTKGDATTSISCTPATRAIGQAATCTASVAGDGVLPAGTVEFTSDGTGEFGPSGTCTLDSSAECSVTYDPAAVGTGDHEVTGAYSGDDNYEGASGGATVSVTNGASTTELSCVPGSVSKAGVSTCTATVSGGGVRPGGTVEFESDAPGDFGAPSCELPVNGDNECSTTYEPAQVGSGTHKVTATYGGDGNYTPSEGSENVAVTPRATQTSLDCAPAERTAGTATTCTATVIDSDSGRKGRPRGTVSFATDGDGAFGATACTLPASGDNACQVTYTPSAAGTHRVTAAYAGDEAHVASTGRADVAVTLPRPETGEQQGPPQEQEPRQPGDQPAAPWTAALTHRHMVLDRGMAVLMLTCRAPAGTVCRGTVALRSTNHRSRTDASKSGSARSLRFSVRAGRSKRLRVPVPDVTHAQLRKRGKAVVLATLRLTQADGSSTKAERAFTIFRRP